MVLILISWVYIFFTSITFGIFISKVFKIKSVDLVTTSFLGLFFSLLVASFWAFFYRINFEFYSVFFILFLICFYFNRGEIKLLLLETKQYLKSFSKTLVILFFTLVILILFQSASLPSITDNETYYIQTIKWLNEYGFVKGLGNLHLFLGQTSGWHILQSVFNFPFLIHGLNNLNGFCLVLFAFWSCNQLTSYFKTKENINLLFGFCILLVHFFINFVSAPSPDLPIYLLSFLIFFNYLKNNSQDGFSTIMLLVLLAFSIKMTGIIFFIFPLIMFINTPKEFKNRLIPIILISIFTIGIFIAKNCILTGYPLFPLNIARIDSFDYSLPKEILEYFSSGAMRNEFFITIKNYNSFSTFQIIKSYFTFSLVQALFGFATLLILVVTPIILFISKKNNRYWAIYFSFLLLLVSLIISSIQVRFYAHFTLFFLLFFLTLIIKKKKVIFALVSTSILITLISLVIPFYKSNRKDAIQLGNEDKFQWKTVLISSPISNENSYRFLQKGNLKYYSPLDTKNFWFTGDGPLPCVSNSQLDYFETYFHFIPQLSGNDLQEGFYAKKCNP